MILYLHGSNVLTSRNDLLVCQNIKDVSVKCSLVREINHGLVDLMLEISATDVKRLIKPGTLERYGKSTCLQVIIY